MDAGEEADVAPAGDATAEADMALEPDAAPCVPLDGDEPGGVGGGGGGPSVGVWAIGAELELADVTFELGPVAPGGASDINPGADGLVGEVYRP